MKTVIACLLTALVVASGAGAYIEVVTPAQFNALQARVQTLEKFDRECLRPIHLGQTPGGWMAWDTRNAHVGVHAAIFFGVPDSSSSGNACATTLRP